MFGIVLRHPLALALAILPACGGTGVPAESQASPGDSDSHAGDAMEGDPTKARKVEAPQGPHPLADGQEPDPSRSLPQLTYTHLGMHIGGESNSAESKKPWLEDIESGETALLTCYRLVSEPEKGGSYGVDLYVGKSGGAPEVRGSRQKLGGEDFDACMKEGFAALSFHKPERPTVFSYSIHFKLE